MARNKLVDADGTVDVATIEGMRRGELIDAYDDLLRELAAAKEKGPGAEHDRAARTVREFRRWQRTERPDMMLDAGAVNVTPATIASSSSTMGG